MRTRRFLRICPESNNQTAHLFGCGWYMLSALTHKECEDIYYDGGDEDFFVNGHKYNSMEYVDSECPWIYRCRKLVTSLCAARFRVFSTLQ